MENTLKKYKLGFLAIGLITLGLFVWLVVQASATKSDAKTLKAAQTAADKLNSYSQGVPDSLAAAGVKDVPSSIKYTKLSSTKYKFCVTYKTTSSDFDASNTLFSLATGGSLNNKYDYNSTDTSYLTVDSSHKKGTTCQTVTPYSFGGSGGISCGLICENSQTDTGGSPNNATDTKRTTDLKSLMSQLEAYYATNGYYPSLTDLNTASWRTANLKGMDAKSFCDPSTSAISCQLADSPKKGAYSYEAYDSDYQPCTAAGQQCKSYILTAMLSNGQPSSEYSENY